MTELLPMGKYFVPGYNIGFMWGGTVKFFYLDLKETSVATRRYIS